MINQAELKSCQRDSFWKFGVLVPRNHAQAVELEKANGKLNPADIVSKHWRYPLIWHLLKPLLFYSGDPRDLIKPGEEYNGKSENDCAV
jgi:hypothetical protein